MSSRSESTYSWKMSSGVPAPWPAAATFSRETVPIVDCTCRPQCRLLSQPGRLRDKAKARKYRAHFGDYSRSTRLG